MSLEEFHNDALNKFETAQNSQQANNLVRSLFDQFQKSGYWHENLAEYCRWIQLNDAERDAESQAYHDRYRAMSEEEQVAHDVKGERPLGNLKWITHLDEFGLCQHTRIDRNDMVIHAFCLGYGEPGRSDDPTMYVIHRPGDEDDYSKVYVVRRKQLSEVRLYEWTCEPIQEMHQQCCKQAADTY
jgi:hypothetical protein